MSDELVPLTKAIEELEPAFEAFAEATGMFGPVLRLSTRMFAPSSG